jgi:hypothetical protein
MRKFVVVLTLAAGLLMPATAVAVDRTAAAPTLPDSTWVR